MQTTLLGLAIAIILALVAALVGPLLIDWGGYRSVFEAEATRLVGLDVRVTGAIDARLLPSPQLTLHDIEIGRAGARKVRARSLGIEFALGPLLRGEWRASEMHLTGPQLNAWPRRGGHACKRPIWRSASIPTRSAIDRLSIEDGNGDAHECRGRRQRHARSCLVQRRGALAARSDQGRGRGQCRRRSLSVSRFPPAARRRRQAQASSSMSIRSIIRSAPRRTGCCPISNGAPSFDGYVEFGGGRSALQPPGNALSQPWRFGGKIKATRGVRADAEFRIPVRLAGQGLQAHRRRGFASSASSRASTAYCRPARSISIAPWARRRHAGRRPPPLSLSSRNWPAALSVPRSRSSSASASTRRRSAAIRVQNLRGDISTDAQRLESRPLRVSRARLTRRCA